MPAILGFLLLVSIVPGAANARTTENFVERADVTKVKMALEKFYKECGFFPDELGRLLTPSINEPGCLRPRRNSILEERERELIDRLEYRPYGYKSYELSVRLIVTDHS